MPDTRVIRLTTALFDVTQERPNPVNPIPGESLLQWLREKSRQQCDLPEPDAEDWGWYTSVTWNGRRYLLGSSASDEENGEREWILQIVKHRTFVEKLLGREKMTPDDECVSFFHSLLKAEPGFRGVSRDPLC